MTDALLDSFEELKQLLETRKSFPGHHGRPGKKGGSLPKGQGKVTVKGPNPPRSGGLTFARYPMNNRESNFPTTRVGEKYLESSAYTGKFRVLRNPENTSPDAIDRLNEFIDELPSELLDESSAREIVVFDDSSDVMDYVEKRTGVTISSDEYLRGMYDRSTGEMVVSLYNDEDTDTYPGNDEQPMGQSGRNFFHEFAHSLEGKVSSDEWLEGAAYEWVGHGLDRDESFAEAFSEYMVDKKVKGESLAWFVRNRPKTLAVFKGWGI